MAWMLDADLERNVSMNLLPTAEQVARIYGWDTGGDAIDAVAEELPGDDHGRKRRYRSSTRASCVCRCSSAISLLGWRLSTQCLTW
jgi:hypothetical protein